MYWLLLLSVATGASAQLTAQSSVAPDLRECYLNATLLNRNNLPPTTLPVLIDIIQQIEDNPNVNLDLRQLAVLILHTYRQDGIEFHQPEQASSANVLPFAPTFHSYHRHRLLITRIIQSPQGQALPNDTIPAPLKCGLHHMLSTTVDSRVRGDENNCNQLSQYRVWRTARDIRSIRDEVEWLDSHIMKNTDENGQIRQFNPDDDVEFTSYSSSRSERQLLGDSQCPILGGVISTPWGAVSAGHLIAGIAAGAQSQTVPVLELAKGSVINYPNVPQYVTALYPATLSGDLAEAALIQGTARGSASINIGTSGNWNSTEARRFFMLSSRNFLEMTDPEIRGDVDGFILGTVIQSLTTNYASLKLSQVLDMYYSPKNGLWTQSDVKACNRQALSQRVITETTLQAETYAFAAALDTNIPLPGTITGGLDQLVNSAITNFQTYMTNTLNDQNCVTSVSATVDYRLATNLYIVIDGAWDYQAVNPAIAYLMDIIEVGKFGSSVTLISAADGLVVVNKTFSQADFHSQYTLARHQSMLTSINLESVLNSVRVMMHAELDEESRLGYVGGNSSVLLFLLQGHVQTTNQIWEQARILNQTVPDLRILFATSTNQFDNLWSLVRDMHNDIMTVPLTANPTNLANNLRSVVDRIQQVARRIINPTCGSNYTGTLSGARQFEGLVEPSYINFYSISPNYFFDNNDNRRVRITRSGGTGSLIVCHSRRITQPRQNSSLGIEENDVTCQTIAASGEVEINLANPCNGFTTINSCPLLYISVQSNAAPESITSAICTDPKCRFPYNIRYLVQINDFGCFSGASGVTISLTMIVSGFFVTIFRL